MERISQLDSSTYYRYDNVGNILQETRGFSPIPFADMQGTVTSGTPDGTQPANHPTRDQQGNLLLGTGGVTYEYDKLGQLTRVNDEYASETWTYEYDQGGNILKKTCQGYTTQPIQGALDVYTYTYGNPSWKDQLTKYNSKAITYDAIGNPLTYDGWAYTWKAGRMLHNMTNGSINATFSYDHTGLRVKKSFNGEDTLYTLNGKKITHVRKQVNGENTVRMHFFYDAQGRPSIIRYNDTDYAYVHNLQGDVIAIVDMDGNKVVEYGYDVWGRPTGKTGALAGTLGADNPFRYRGYTYDEETGLYYLRSRYYSPEWGRFINADVFIGIKGSILSHNVFSYCKSSPIVFADDNGKLPVNQIEEGIYYIYIGIEDVVNMMSSGSENNQGRETSSRWKIATLKRGDKVTLSEHEVDDDYSNMTRCYYVDSDGKRIDGLVPTDCLSPYAPLSEENMPIVERGDTSYGVRFVQHWLSMLYPKTPVDITGHFGDRTRNLVKNFQRENLSEATGNFGRATGKAVISKINTTYDALYGSLRMRGIFVTLYYVLNGGKLG